MTRLLVALEAGLGHIERRNDSWGGRVSLEGREVRCVAVDPHEPRRVYAGTFGDGLWRSLDGGESFERSDDGIGPDEVMAVAVSVAERGAAGGVVWAGTEPSELYRSEDGGDNWVERPALKGIPSRDTWSFPPRPWTHHVRWIEPDPHVAGRLFVGIELGGVMRSLDAGMTFEDRKPGSEHDCHTLRTHPEVADRVYEAAGGGYAESRDGGDTWSEREEGLDHRYAWGLAVDPGDPDTVLVSAAAGPSRAYRRESAESYVYRRAGSGGDGGNGRDGPWQRVDDGLPAPDGTRIFALATHPARAGVFWAVNGYDLHRSTDAGSSWERLPLEWPEGFEPSGCQGVALVED